ncbi:MAG: GAF domain-containing sensor histidine kinase [Nostoc sp.]
MSLDKIIRPMINRITRSLGLPEIDSLQAEIAEASLKLQEQAEQQKALYRVVSKIRASLDLESIFRTTTKETCKLLGVERIAVYRFHQDWSGKFVSNFEFSEPGWIDSSIWGENSVWNDTYLQEHQGGRYRQNEPLVLDDVRTSGLSVCHLDILEQFQIRAYATVPIFVKQTLWGVLAAYQHSKPHHWKTSDIEFLTQVAAQLGVAVQQAELLNQTADKAQALDQASSHQEILLKVIGKIRESLDLDTLFKTTAQEVRKTLRADRVGVFYFYPDSNYCYGEFVSEAVVPGYDSAIAIKVQDYCFGEQYAVQYQQGRMQVVSNIYNAAMKDCHIAVLEQFQIQAQIITPLMKCEKLWGLLCVHQCEQPREWKNSEIQFIKQLAGQFSVALEQSDLLAQTRRQSDELAQALKSLQQAQIQIVQAEKMASLGQLIAGIAHEINNPVNFIHGNLNYVHEYVKHLLNLLEIYQTSYPEQLPEIHQHTKAIDIEFLREDLPKTLESMQVGTERISEIVLLLRNFSRLDESEIKVVNIHQGIESTLTILQHRLQAKANCPEIIISRNYGNLPDVECYAGQLNQVFMNILTNAIDALEMANFEQTDDQMKGNPWQININTSVIDFQWVKITFTDNGLGIPEEAYQRIFDPFFTTKPVGKGVGMGMSISYQIITEKHGGKLTYYSTLGKGSEFVIHLPIRLQVSEADLKIGNGSDR